ncbi:MAG: hypothetical protein ACETV1_06220 [Candidatus Bathyarchaeia archaeon]
MIDPAREEVTEKIARFLQAVADLSGLTLNLELYVKRERGPWWR